jgi:hypothetical protein
MEITAADAAVCNAHAHVAGVHIHNRQLPNVNASGSVQNNSFHFYLP